jgi:sulfhydrogenase subunit beta (sulfur reductase)
MSGSSLNLKDKVIIERANLNRMLECLQQRGYQVIGPIMRDGVIVYEEVSSAADFPEGWTDEQSNGKYRLKRRDDRACFGYVVGPYSWKKYLHPPVLRLWKADLNGKGFQIQPETEDPPRFAFFGVRSCELYAMAVQDKVFEGGQFVDPSYKARRENAFLVVVQCSQAGGNCFCASMNTGPKATEGFDIALTELLEADTHHFLVEIGSEKGAELMADIPHEAAGDEKIALAERIWMQTAQNMGRSLDTSGIKELFYRHYDHPRWEQVASRCLTCANCTMVCPTCFCVTVEDVTDLTGEHAERWRKWDSCFTNEFSYIHGGSVRSSDKARYRQWITHKLASWIDQFGTSGCVGCGRCITWCPVGIDITEEANALRSADV